MKLYWDYENQKLLDSPTGQQLQSVTMVLRDLVDVTLITITLDPVAQTYVVADPPTGLLPIFGIKGITEEELAGGYLADQLTWARSAVGTFVATINLNTIELIAEMGTEVSASLTAEFTLRDGADANHFSTQIGVTILYDVNNAGGDAAVGAYTGALLHEEVINGQKTLILCNSDGVECARFSPPGA